jgi:hypothetical protein
MWGIRRRKLMAVRKEWGVMVREAKVLHGHTGVRRMRWKAVREEWAAMVMEVKVLKGVRVCSYNVTICKASFTDIPLQCVNTLKCHRAT